MAETIQQDVPATMFGEETFEFEYVPRDHSDYEEENKHDVVLWKVDGLEEFPMFVNWPEPVFLDSTSVFGTALARSEPSDEFIEAVVELTRYPVEAYGVQDEIIEKLPDHEKEVFRVLSNSMVSASITGPMAELIKWCKNQIDEDDDVSEGSD